MGYNIKQKIEICLKAEAHPEMTQGDLANWAMQQYGSARAPSQTTISRILSSKNELVASKSADFSLVRRRKQQNPLLRRILTEWITQALWENIPITTPIIQSTANAIWTRLPSESKDGNGVFNQKWCNHFLKKLNVNLRGDNADIYNNPGNHTLHKVWKLDEKLELKHYLAQIIDREQYKPQDIFTIDEFQLFYSLPLDQIFDVSSIDKGLKQSSSSTEKSVTIMLGVNLDGSEKLTPMVVGRYDKFDVSQSSNPSLKHGVGSSMASSSTAGHHASGNSHSNSNSSTATHTLMNKITEVYNLYYKSNANKWITSSMFQNYLLTLEHKLASAAPNRKILILLDDPSSHRIINLKFSNIRLCYLKNNSNHKNPYGADYNGVKFDYLPMSFGIIEEFKVLYRLQQYLEMINIQRNKAKGEGVGIDEDESRTSNVFGGSTGAAAAMEEAAAAVTTTGNSKRGNSVGNNASPSANAGALTESDYDVPLIKVIEWIKRSWDSISTERIILSWKRTNLISFKQPWPCTNPEVSANAVATLQPLLQKAESYNCERSYEKLVEIMEYLNVVIPWKADELLGLVNERGKVSLSYVSIEEIIGSCFSEDACEEEDSHRNRPAPSIAPVQSALSTSGHSLASATSTTNSIPTSSATAVGISRHSTGLTPFGSSSASPWFQERDLKDRATPMEVDTNFDMSYPEFSNSSVPNSNNSATNSMNINSLLAAIPTDPVKHSPLQKPPQNVPASVSVPSMTPSGMISSGLTPSNMFMDSSSATLPPLMTPPFSKIHQPKRSMGSEGPASYWYTAEKRRKLPGQSSLLGNNTIPQMYGTTAAMTPTSVGIGVPFPGVGSTTQGLTGNEGMIDPVYGSRQKQESKDAELINTLTKILDASNSGDKLQLSTATLAELRNNLQEAQSRYSNNNLQPYQ
ncbi:protein Pdc2p [[Candida] anglica]|uniref:Protein Pdc2p n=1 Tax=[Candida] anglica TaxID=148631 RepID=A0ABP0E6D1_9ASCO